MKSFGKATSAWPFLFFCLWIPGAISNARAGDVDLHSLSKSEEWRRLLHYRVGIAGRDKSEADGMSFFLSPSGKTDPESELVADIKAFKSDRTLEIGDRKAHPQCFFPARFRFLRDHGALDGVEARRCQEFQDWKARFRPKSVTLIYAAPYFGSPASMFGHTFLRVDSSRSPLLSHSISFEAFTGGDDGGMGYAVKGLIGLYPGTYSLQPYYLKTNIYSNVESRDLWEYELNLTPEQIDRMLDHAWEMGTTYFNYYFFDENCSYHLLSLLEAARPDWDLKRQFVFSAIPADTVRAIRSIPGSVRSLKRRPSLMSVLETRLDRMPTEEQNRFFYLKEHPEKTDESDSAAVLDALLDWQKSRALSESRTFNDPEKQVEQKLLVLRSRKSDPADDLDRPSAQWPRPLAPPEEGHLSAKLSLRVGSEEGRGFGGIEFRPALHDELDADAGYLPNSKLVLGKTVVEYQWDQPKQLRLDELTLGEVTALNPLSRLRKPLSWQVVGGLYRPKDTGCDACVAGRFRAGGGVTIPLNPSSIAYSLLNAQIEASGSFSPTFRAGPSLQTGILASITPKTKFEIEGEYFRYYPDQEIAPSGFWHTRVGLSQNLDRFELRLNWEGTYAQAHPDRRAWLTIGWYY